MAPSALNPTVYLGAFIHTPDLNTLSINPEGAIAVNAEGKIEFIDAKCPATATRAELSKRISWAVTDFDIVRIPLNCTGFFFPGFVDTHTHASQYPNTGLFGSSTLLDWLETYTFPLESSFSSIERARVVYSRVVQRGLSHGTTCAAYYATVHVEATNLLADICREKGQRALVGRVCMDRLSPENYRDESPDTAIEDTKKTIAHILSIDPTGDIVRPVITPRFAPSCTGISLQKLGQLHEESGHFAQTHMSENQPEIELVKSLFPGSKNYASVYKSAGLLTPKMILAHCVHLTSDEVALIAEHKTNISHCPTSNTCLTSGAAKVRDMLDAGITVGLGTDMSGGYSPSILEMARQAMLVSRHVAMQDGDSAKLSIKEALYLATKGGANAVGLGDKIGSFEVGMDWDAQMIYLDNVTDGSDEKMFQTGPVDIFGWESWEDRVAKWLYGGDDRNTVAVFVKGQRVHTIEHRL